MENEMNITNAQYNTDLSGNNSCVKCTIDGVDWLVPLDSANTHYAEILKQVEAGDLTIADAD
jgi:hypothetical protein